MSSSKPNMQQAPSTEQYRKMFVAKPGWKLVDSDYSSAELFIAAYQETSSYCLQLSKGMTFTVTLHF
jgi:DNA polymerase I-like protein with 3'-5' exonuclease and polymerase domains